MANCSAAAAKLDYGISSFVTGGYEITHMVIIHGFVTGQTQPVTLDLSEYGSSGEKWEGTKKDRKLELG